MPDATESQNETTPVSTSSPAINGNHDEPDTNTEDAPFVKHEQSEVECELKHELPATAPEDEDATKASKKRKFDELNARSRSASRAASPPWRAFGADGPTQFTENGKRRSGRVNYIPLELQTPSDKRTTRAAHESSLSKKLEQHASPTTSKTKASGLKVEVKPSPLTKSISTATAKAESQEQGSDTPRATRVSSRLKTAPKSLDDIQAPPVTPASAPSKKRSGRARRESEAENAPAPKTPPENKRGKRQSFGDSQHGSKNAPPSPKLRLKIPRGPMYPRHPDFIPKPAKYASLIEVLESYDIKEREAGPEGRTEENGLEVRDQPPKVVLSPEEVTEQEARARLRLLEAAKPGGLLSEERNSLFFPDAQPQPPQDFSHNDHLWAHGAYFRILMRRERTKHMDLAKRTAYACLAKWKERQPQTQEELQKQENEWFKLIYRQTVKDVQRKWELITAEIERRRLAKWVEEQALSRDKKMQRLLEDTTKMLDRRRVGFEDSELSDTEDIDDQLDSALDNDDSEGITSGSEDDSEDDSDDEHNMTSSDSESDAENAADGDENLSPEALRAKYANLPELEHSDNENNDDNDDDAMDVDEDDNEDAAAYADDTEAGSIADMSHVVLEEVNDELLDDEDDESTDMSDDMGSSDEDDSEAEEESEEEEEGGTLGLLGFLGGKERKKIQEVSQDVTMDDADDAHKASGLADDDTEQAVLEATTEAIDVNSLHPATSVEGDHSSQPTPIDSSVAGPTEADSTTTVDPDEMPGVEQTTDEGQSAPKITTKVPSLLRATLREYQHYGLDWLAKLYVNQTNGILADEMGLGKTIQTIALLAHLAEEHQIWGPHLIVVPTSVILNWEMEFKKFLPGFKVLSYYGTQEERQQKRKGWSNPDNYNVVITSYQLVLKDLSSIRVPEWHYMILDEAHNIKNFQSQRYQAMIRLKTHARLLLTGTPLQNSIQELWSLLTFLTAGQDGQGMGDLDEFTQWFKRPVDEIFVDGKNKLGVEAQAIVNKLHHSLRPYILRRMKSQVETQLPGKYEHTIFCRLSKRQRQLYDAFLSRTDVKEKLSSGNPISVSQALMALRKVCNHPDLFEERPIVTSFTLRKPYSRMARSVVADYEIKDLLVRRDLLQKEESDSHFNNFILKNFDLQRRERISKHHAKRGMQLNASKCLERWVVHMTLQRARDTSLSGTSLEGIFTAMHSGALDERLERLETYIGETDKRANFAPMYGADLVAKCTVLTNDRLRMPKARSSRSDRLTFDDMGNLSGTIQSIDERGTSLIPTVQRFAFVTPNAMSHDLATYSYTPAFIDQLHKLGHSSAPDPFHEARVRLSIAFPDKRLLQYDCGKLQRLALLLRELTSRGSRALIFTQMTSVLNILERFLNIHGYKYMRLDGSTRIEQRQDMMERFNRDERIDVFILSSRSGGVGMNLTGADSVIFYDLDWNPQMDKQCQDRAHRIGQTRDVHIYKMVAEHTIEVNILRKSNQKRMLDEVVIQEGEFTTDFFHRPSAAAADDTAAGLEAQDEAGAAVDRVLGLDVRKADVGKVLAAAEDGVDVEAAKAQAKEARLDEQDFDERRAIGPGEATPIGGATPGPAVDDDDDDDEVAAPHVDEYMLRWMEEMLRLVPFVPPVDKKRGRLDKNGRDRGHRPKRL